MSVPHSVVGRHGHQLHALFSLNHAGLYENNPAQRFPLPWWKFLVCNQWHWQSKGTCIRPVPSPILGVGGGRLT